MQNEIKYVKDTFEEYLGNKTHVSASDIKNFLHSPRYYYYKKHEEVKVRNTEKDRQFPIGSAVHELVLEPELFWANYCVAEKHDLRTKVGKEKQAEFLANIGNKTMLYEDEMTMALAMAEQGTKNQTFMELIKESYRELSCYTQDEQTGLLIRMRPDSFAKNKSTIVDIKTCKDSSFKAFKRDVYTYGYNISAAFYGDFLKRDNYVFCAMEKQQPYQTALYVCSDEMIDYGRKQYRLALDLLKWSNDNNYWCDYNEFEILKECYELGNLKDFFDIRDKSEKITILL